eukprot:5694145-Pleurochrysis_carterae.AAC.1
MLPAVMLVTYQIIIYHDAKKSSNWACIPMLCVFESVGGEIEISVQIASGGEAAICYVTKSVVLIRSPDGQRLDGSIRQC